MPRSSQEESSPITGRTTTNRCLELLDGSLSMFHRAQPTHASYIHSVYIYIILKGQSMIPLSLHISPLTSSSRQHVFKPFIKTHKDMPLSHILELFSLWHDQQPHFTLYKMYVTPILYLCHLFWSATSLTSVSCTRYYLVFLSLNFSRQKQSGTQAVASIAQWLAEKRLFSCSRNIHVYTWPAFQKLSV